MASRLILLESSKASHLLTFFEVLEIRTPLGDLIVAVLLQVLPGTVVRGTRCMPSLLQYEDLPMIGISDPLRCTAAVSVSPSRPGFFSYGPCTGRPGGVSGYPGALYRSVS